MGLFLFAFDMNLYFRVIAEIPVKSTAAICFDCVHFLRFIGKGPDGVIRQTRNGVFRGRKLMGSWQSKILYTLIIFGAGFVTAVYFLVPSPAAAADRTQIGEMSTGSYQAQNTAGRPDIISQQWALSLRSGIDTCIHFAEEHALRAADLIRSQMGQGSDADG